ncbi:MAG: Uma2 family endonuclease, partial [Gammaproteobacteria bacterium]
LFVNDMKVRCSSAGDERYYYPDIIMSCVRDEADPYFLEHPCMIVEVLSPSTERTDRSDKFFAYRRIPSLMEYVLVAQDTRRVEIYRRRTQWELELYLDDASIELECAQAGITLDQIYRNAEPEEE